MLEAAASFARVSGLAYEDERAALLERVQTVLADHGLEGDWTCRLCMLGVSAVVVPRQPSTASSMALEGLRDPLEVVGLEVAMCGLAALPSDEEE